MIKLLPLLLMLGYGYLMWRFSAAQSSAALKQQSRRLDDPALEAVTQKLAKALDLPQILVNIYDIDTVNGLAAHDGQIYLTRGFMERREKGEVTDAELASVIAHELGHVALGHAKRRMIEFSGQNAMHMVVATLLNRFLPGIGALISRQITNALMARLSRRDEFEADAYAAALLVKSGIGVEPQVSLFRKLGKLTGSDASGVPAWMRSHPKAEQRIAAIEEMAARWQA